jgi:hypothetical protein
VRVAVVEIDLSICSSILTLIPLLLQKKCKNLFQHNFQSVVTIIFFKFKSFALILLVDRKIFTKFHIHVFFFCFTAEWCVLYWWLFNPFRSYIGPRPTIWFSSVVPMSEIKLIRFVVSAKQQTTLNLTYSQIHLSVDMT